MKKNRKEKGILIEGQIKAPISLYLPLEKIDGSYFCEFSVIENKLEILYRNQEKIYTLLQKIDKSSNKDAAAISYLFNKPPINIRHIRD